MVESNNKNHFDVKGSHLFIVDTFGEPVQALPMARKLRL
jgi:hypothetical protein